MKSIFLLIFLFCFSAGFAQKNDTCEMETNKAIRSFYNGRILYNTSDSLFFNQTFFCKNEEIMHEINQWAKANGYETKERKVETPTEKNESKIDYILIIEKHLEKRDLNYFTNEINMTTAMRKKLKYTDCGSMMGIGISIMPYYKK